MGKAAVEVKNVINILDIVDISYLQSLSNYFASITDVTGAFFDLNGIPITVEKERCNLCEHLRHTKEGMSLCMSSDKGLIKMADDKNRLVFHNCKCIRLIDFCIPIQIEVSDNSLTTIGYFIGGQLRYKKNVASFYTTGSPNLNSKLSNQFNSKTIKNKYKDVHQIKTKSEHEKLENCINNFAKQVNLIMDYMHKCKPKKKYASFQKNIMKCSNLDQILSTALNQVLKLINASAVSIFTVAYDSDKNKKRLILRKTTHEGLKKQENIGFYECGYGLTGWVWKNKRSLRIEDLQDESVQHKFPGLKWRQHLNDNLNHKTYLAVPIIGIDNEVIGVIRASMKKGNDVFTLEDELFLNYISAYISFAISHMDSNKKVQKVLGEDGILSKVVRNMSSYLNSEKLFDYIVEGIESILKYKDPANYLADKRYFLNIITDQDRNWIIKRTAGELPLKEEYMNDKVMQFTINEGITGQVIRDNGKFISHNIADRPDNKTFLAVVDMEYVRSVICIPIKYEDTISGVIAIVSRQSYAFSEEDVLYLEILGMICGYAINNALTSDNTYRKMNRYLGHHVNGPISTMKKCCYEIDCCLKSSNRKEIENETYRILPEEQYLSLKEEVERLQRLADNAIFINSAIGSFCDRNRNTQFDVGEAIDKAIKLTVGLENNKYININRDYLENLTACNDIGLFIQTIIAILDNSVTAINEELGENSSRKGNIIIKTLRNNSKLKVSIKDDGIGMSREELKKYKTRFTKFTTSKGAGHGIGKEFIFEAVKKMEGEIIVKSKEHQGTRITFDISNKREE